MKTYKQLVLELNEVSVAYRTARGALLGGLYGTVVGFNTGPLVPVTAGLGATVGAKWAHSTAKKINAVHTDPKYAPGTIYKGFDGQASDGNADYQILSHHSSSGTSIIKHLGTGETIKLDSDDLPDIRRDKA